MHSCKATVPKAAIVFATPPLGHSLKLYMINDVIVPLKSHSLFTIKF